MTRAAPATATVGTRARGELRIAGLPGAATGRLPVRQASQTAASRKRGVAPRIEKSARFQHPLPTPMKSTAPRVLPGAVQ